MLRNRVKNRDLLGVRHPSNSFKMVESSEAIDKKQSKGTPSRKDFLAKPNPRHQNKLKFP